MKKSRGINVATALAIVLVLALAFTALGQSRFSVQDNETVRRTLEFSSGAGTKILEIDNIRGSIRVAGYDGRNIEMIANKTIRAESPERVQSAKQEVKLDITDNADTVRIYVDDPRRCSCRDGSNGWRSGSRWNDPGYRVTFDFEIRVPRAATVRLRTVNDGNIHVQDVAGDFDVEDINGSIEMLEMSGSGRAYALNGQMKVSFSSNPKRESYFGTLNGNVEVLFQPNLSADLRLKTFNGRIYTDFPITALPSAGAATAERRNGKFVYRSNEFSAARVGNGGPEIKFEGFNGNIRILSAR